MRRWRIGLALALLALLSTTSGAWADPVRARDLGRFDGMRETALIGYGVVTGLTGTGDSPNNAVTQQALSNVLGRMGARIPPGEVRSRNVAVVMVTAVLPSSSDVGDRLDIQVTSIGDARSLAGGVLLMTPLAGPDQRVYALAQGPLVVGGFQFSSDLAAEQRNFPGAAVVSGGATVEVPMVTSIQDAEGRLTFLLRRPDFTTAVRLADAVNAQIGPGLAVVRDADAVTIDATRAGDLFRFAAAVENVVLEPAAPARVVINERSGTVVAGGEVRISSVVVSQGGVRVSITADRFAAQPSLIGGYAPNVRSLVVTNTSVAVADEDSAVVTLDNTTVADLITALSRARVSTRGQIAILQSIHAAGALHAELVVQ